MATVTRTRDTRRSSGLERSTIGPALLVLALAVLMSVVLPSIDSATSYRDEINRGDVAQIADELTLVPASGWNLASGALVGETRSTVGTTATTEVVDGSVELQIQAAPFDGTPSELLKRINEIEADLARLQGNASTTTRRYAVRTRQGAVGVAEDVAGVHQQGTIIAFVFPAGGQQTGEEQTGQGVQVVASGPKGAISRRRDDIVAMIRSIRTTR